MRGIPRNEPGSRGLEIAVTKLWRPEQILDYVIATDGRYTPSKMGFKDFRVVLHELPDDDRAFQFSNRALEDPVFAFMLIDPREGPTGEEIKNPHYSIASAIFPEEYKDAIGRLDEADKELFVFTYMVNLFTEASRNRSSDASQVSRYRRTPLFELRTNNHSNVGAVLPLGQIPIQSMGLHFLHYLNSLGMQDGTKEGLEEPKIETGIVKIWAPHQIQQYARALCYRDHNLEIGIYELPDDNGAWDFGILPGGNQKLAISLTKGKSTFSPDLREGECPYVMNGVAYPPDYKGELGGLNGAVEYLIDLFSSSKNSEGRPSFELRIRNYNGGGRRDPFDSAQDAFFMEFHRRLDERGLSLE